MPTAAEIHESPATVGAPATGPRRVWAPVLWVALLAGGCGWLWNTDADPGFKNTVIHLSFALGVAGVGVWTLRSSGLGGWRRPVFALTPMVVVAAYYLQFLPIETINNGDVGIVGWRWRWDDPDRALDVPPPRGRRTLLEWREGPHDFPAFLGGRPWAEVEGVALETNWKEHPPRELWKHRIGAGWSGVAIVGDYAATQEQRGEQELVVCYELRTGKTAWAHADPVRWDPRGGGALGGVGPRATPTIHDGRVFAHGATGILNCIDAATGKLLWSHDTLGEHGSNQVMWGKAGSPLIVDDRVVVSVGGADDASLVAYEIADGAVAWSAGTRQSSYATPVLAELSGERQILSVNEGYVTAHRATDGAVLWEHEWPSSSDSSAAASQPVPIGGDRVLLTKGYGQGAELIQIERDGDEFVARSVWMNRAALKTKMGNVVVRDGYAYGLDDVFLQCVDLETGRPKWKKRRSPSFGHGQIMLVGDAILILSEEGEVILAKAAPTKYHELASMPALEGVTWNTPALGGRAGNVLVVRNAEQAAALELPVRGGGAVASRE